MCRLARRDFGSDFNRLAGGGESVHPGGGDADALLSSAHSEPVKFGAVEKFSEDEGYLFFDDTGSVVLNGDFEFVFTDGLNSYPDFGQDSGFFAGIERVIDGFFDGGEECFPWIIEAEQVPVLCEEFADGDFFFVPL